MSKLLFLVILIIGLIFVETLLGSLSGLSIAIALSLLLYDRFNIKTYLGLFIPLSVVIDISNHTFTGAALIAMLVSTFVFILSKKYLPFEGNTFIKLLAVIVPFLIFHLLYFTAFYVSDNAIKIGLFNLELFWLIFKLSLAELIFYLVFEFIIDYISTEKNQKLTLKR